jgi:cytochrome c oxidase accessory protein FixG
VSATPERPGAPRPVPIRVVVQQAANESVEQSLYEVRRKIYPRAVHGNFARARWTLIFLTQLVFYGAPWLLWNARQAVLFDLAARKFYVMGLVFWPQDFFYLAALLIISALSLFLFTAIAGRLWCGYACPQTVYTEIFLWVERAIEGDRNARMKLDAAPMDARKAFLKSAKHGVWIAMALWTGFTFVGYFTPIRELVHSARSLAFGPWETFWIGFYGLATYGNAGWMREQVCKYMCPYARFQSAMFDRDTLVITYDSERGDPRGSRSRKADPRAMGLGDCVDCNICVQVCPTGIDIRQGLQYECIGCAACIDGCDQVMDKMGYSRGLIRYSTENALAGHWTARQMVKRLMRPRVLVYVAILLAILLAAAFGLGTRAPLRADVIRDRGALAREADDGRIENVYRLQVMNAREEALRLSIDVRSTAPLARLEAIADAPLLDLEPLGTRVIAVRVRAEPGALHGSQPIEFVLTAAGWEGTQSETFRLAEKSRFMLP